MAELGDASTSSSPPNPRKSKPVFVRVKRKASQATVDAFWLEIDDRPSKKPLLEFGNLSISDSTAGKVSEESRTKKVLVQHVETIGNSEAINDVLRSFLHPDSSSSKEDTRKFDERRSMHKQDKRHSQLQSIARQEHEDLVKKARFEQIWKRRRQQLNADEDSLHEICHLYDVVRVDTEDEIPGRLKNSEVNTFEDDAILCNYLPLIREYLPSAAADIESDMLAYARREDNYVYDLYTAEDSVVRNEEDTTEYPLVQVKDNDDDYYDGPLQSEYETDDSNAEDNPLNDYPEEESTGDDADDVMDPLDDLEGSDSQYEVDDTDEEDEEGWR